MPYDFLATMAWDVGLSGILLAAGAEKLHYQTSTASIDEKNSKFRMGFVAAIGACGFYLFLSGVDISFTWPFMFSGGVYNVLFGGIATLGGLLLLAVSLVTFLNADLRFVAYFAAVVGLYAVIDSYAIVKYALTDAPLLAALGYLSFAAPAFLTVPATHSKSKLWRWLFVLFAILFSIAWLYQAANFTLDHLMPS